jgi:IS5 family transposase
LATNQRTRYKGFIDEVVRAKNRNKSRIRSRLKHVFDVVKRLWGFDKARYRSVQKNATRAFTALALANIYLDRKSLAITHLAQALHLLAHRMPRTADANRH